MKRKQLAFRKKSFGGGGKWRRFKTLEAGEKKHPGGSWNEG